MELVTSKKYNFDMNTIYSEMTSLLYQRAIFINGRYQPNYIPYYAYTSKDYDKYLKLDIKGKIEAINNGLKHFLVTKLNIIPEYQYNELMEKSIPDLVDIMNNYCENNQDVWAMSHYIIGLINEICGINFLIWGSDDESLRDMPCIDLEKYEIQTHTEVNPAHVFKLIYLNLFNAEYLESGTINQKQYMIKPCKNVENK